MKPELEKTVLSVQSLYQTLKSLDEGSAWDYDEKRRRIWETFDTGERWDLGKYAIHPAVQKSLGVDYTGILLNVDDMLIEDCRRLREVKGDNGFRTVFGALGGGEEEGGEKEEEGGVTEELRSIFTHKILSQDADSEY